MIDPARMVGVLCHFYDPVVPAIFPEFFNELPGFMNSYPDFMSIVPNEMHQNTQWSIVVGTAVEDNIIESFLGSSGGVVSLFMGRMNPESLAFTMTPILARTLATSLAARAAAVDSVSFSASPASIAHGGARTVTFTGINTQWTTTGASFAASFGDATIGTVTVNSDTSASAAVTVTTTTGIITYTDNHYKTTACQLVT